MLERAVKRISLGGVTLKLEVDFVVTGHTLVNYIQRALISLALRALIYNSVSFNDCTDECYVRQGFPLTCFHFPARRVTQAAILQRIRNPSSLRSMSPREIYAKELTKSFSECRISDIDRVSRAISLRT